MEMLREAYIKVLYLNFRLKFALSICFKYILGRFIRRILVGAESTLNVRSQNIIWPYQSCEALLLHMGLVIKVRIKRQQYEVKIFAMLKLFPTLQKLFFFKYFFSVTIPID